MVVNLIVNLIPIIIELFDFIATYERLILHRGRLLFQFLEVQISVELDFIGVFRLIVEGHHLGCAVVYYQVTIRCFSVEFILVLLNLNV